MGLRSTIGTAALGFGRSVGNMLGCELAVDVSDHSIETKMVPPSATDERAWDDQLYVKGNLFVDGYANPVKLRVDRNEGLENPDEVAVEESGRDDDNTHTKVMSSARYRAYMVQQLISELLNPSERLTMIQWILVGIGGMMLMGLVLLAAVASAVCVF